MSYSVQAFYRAEHDDEPVIVRNDAEVDALVEALTAEPLENSVAALYVVERPTNVHGLPDHELRLGVDGDDRVAGLWFMGEAGSFYSKGSVSKYETPTFYYAGHEATYPRDSEITLDTARQAVKEFLASGGERPTCLDWQPAN